MSCIIKISPDKMNNPPTIARPAIPPPNIPRPQQTALIPIPRPQQQPPGVPIPRPGVPIPRPQQTALIPIPLPQQPPAIPIPRPVIPRPQEAPAVPIPRPAATLPIPQEAREVVTDDYYPQDQPGEDEFQFKARAENSDLIQATIRTARDVFPSLETFIRVAEEVELQYYHGADYGHLMKRSRYPSYMKDASTYEINRIYEGLAAAHARELISLISYFDAWPDRSREYDIYLGIKSVMDDMGYDLAYSGQYSRRIGFVKKGVTTVWSGIPLTPENFVKTVTPDKAILMEAWREKTANGSATEDGASNLSILRLGETRDDLFNSHHAREKAARDEAVERTGDVRYRHMPLHQFRQGLQTDINRTPLIFTLGFSNQALRAAIGRSIEKLPDRLRPREDAGFRAKRKYIMYNTDENTEKMQEKYLPMGQLFPKSYYMMVYNELMIRGLIT